MFFSLGHLFCVVSLSRTSVCFYYDEKNDPLCVSTFSGLGWDPTAGVLSRLMQHVGPNLTSEWHILTGRGNQAQFMLDVCDSLDSFSCLLGPGSLVHTKHLTILLYVLLISVDIFSR